MYYIGICDDGKNICADMEKMVLQYGQDRNIKLETELWHTGEEVCQYLRDRRSRWIFCFSTLNCLP